MEQRVYEGSLNPDALAQALIDEWDRDDTVAQGFGEADRLIVQIGQREVGWFSDEPHQAITLDIEAVPNGLQVTMGQQQWYKDNGVQIMAGGLIGFLPFFFTFPIGQMFGEGIDQRLPSRIWQSVDTYAARMAGAGVGDGASASAAPVTGKTQRLTTIPCLECGVANPQGATRCSACGANLASPAACPQCGHTNPPGAFFCNRCGTQLRAVT
jgi:ribosomal protein L40E